MIVELEYKPCYKDENGKWQDALSMVACDECGVKREQSKYRAVQKQTHYCLPCGTKHQKGNTLEEYEKLAQRRNFKLIKKAKIKKQRSIWECQKGHVWEACFHSINRGTGCPICANRIPKTLVEYHMLAKSKGFEFLGEQVINTSYIQEWKCKCGKIWNTNYETIKNVKGCRECWHERNRGKEHYMWIEDRELVKTNAKCFKLCRGFVRRCIKIKEEKTYELLGYTSEDLKKHIESTWEPWMNWDNYGRATLHKRTWQVDHIKPIKEFLDIGIIDPKVINALCNLRALKSQENLGRYGRKSRICN